MRRCVAGRVATWGNPEQFAQGDYVPNVNKVMRNVVNIVKATNTMNVCISCVITGQ